MAIYLRVRALRRIRLDRFVAGRLHRPDELDIPRHRIMESLCLFVSLTQVIGVTRRINRSRGSNK